MELLVKSKWNFDGISKNRTFAWHTKYGKICLPVRIKGEELLVAMLKPEVNWKLTWLDVVNE